MNLWKKDINKESYEYVFEALLDQKIKINDLNLEKPIHRKAAFNYIKDKPNSLSELNTENEKAFLRYLVKRDYKLFLYLKPEQYEEELAKHYLLNRLQEDKDTTPGFLRRSFDESLVFSMCYDTCNGEQIFYYDKDINATTFLISKFEISFKVNSVVELLKKLDVSVSMIGYNVLFNELMCWVNKEYRKTIIKFVTNKEVGVYKINALYDEIERETVAALNNALVDAGIIVQKLAIQKLSISENAARILEKDGLERIKEKIKRESELEYEKLALDNYERKAKIHKENPNFELTLTEAEKDFALDRYITKNLADNGKLKQAEFKDELLERKKKSTSTTLKKGEDVPHLQEEKKNKYGFLFISAIISLIVAILMLLANNVVTSSIGSVFLVLSIVVFLVAVGLQNNANKKGSDKASLNGNEDYQAIMEEYNEKKENES